VWNYTLNFEIKDEIYKPKINKCYINYLNYRTGEDYTFFTGPIVTRYKNIKNECLNHLRTLRKMKNRYVFLDEGGWHFNALGGIQKKITSFRHPVYTEDYMQQRTQGGWRDEEFLPEYILKNKEKYKHLFL